MQHQVIDKYNNAVSDFISQSDAWCATLGYSLFSSSTDGTMRNYVKYDGTCSASIINRFVHFTTTTEICCVADWQFLHITTGQVQFMHPRVDAMLDAVHDLYLASAEAQQRIHHRKVLAAYQGATNG